FLLALVTPLFSLLPYPTLFRPCRLRDGAVAAQRRAARRGVAGLAGGRARLHRRLRDGAVAAHCRRARRGVAGLAGGRARFYRRLDRKSTRLNSSHEWISYAVFC